MEIFILLIWLAFGMIGFNMAEKRGREKWLGFLSGLLFGVISFIYYAMAGDTEEKKRERLKEVIKEVKK